MVDANRLEVDANRMEVEVSLHLLSPSYYVKPVEKTRHIYVRKPYIHIKSSLLY